MLQIHRAQAAEQFREIAKLMRAFIEWHYDRHSADRDIIDSYFDPAKFDAELNSLPGEFAPPAGALLVAEADGKVVGCVALRPLRDGACEMKRMFVAPEHHGKGLGLLLGQAIIKEANSIGYHTMMLDTGPAQREAQSLYHKLGFRVVQPYYDLTPELREWLVFMELKLSERVVPS